MKFSILFIACLAVLSSCAALGFYDDGGFLNRGERTSYGQYVPKKPNYKLKVRGLWTEHSIRVG